MNKMNNKKPIFDRKSIFFSFMTLLLFLAIAALIMKTNCGLKTPKNNPAWITQMQRELANKLRGAGLLKESAKAYEQYLETANASPGEWSKMAYTIGQIYMEAREYENALPWLYQVELTDAQTELKSSVGPLIINCLERLGRHQAAEYALAARTSLDPNKISEETKGDKIVAQIGEEKIYLNQINEALDNLPPWIKNEFADIEKKREFVKHYIAEELLYIKGIKLRYINDPEVRKRIEQLTRQIVIDQVRKREIEDKMVIDDEDVKNYFIAHRDEYNDPNQEKGPEFEEIKERVKTDYRNTKIQQGYQNLIQQSISSTDLRLYLDNVD